MDDTNLTNLQTVSDDPELAKVLAGVNASTNDAEENDDLQFEGLGQQISSISEDNMIAEDNPNPEVESNSSPINVNGLNLEDIKINALHDLRPLVDKLNVSNEEKFDIYLLLLRSSDDNTLVEPAYEAARNIEDETKRANALLDVIKEIDYFNSKQSA